MLKEYLKERASNLGFVALGFAEASALREKHTDLAGAGLPPFVPYTPCQRCDPNTWLPGAKTVIAGAWSYRERYRTSIHSPGEGKGYFSPFAASPDYHSLVKEKLAILAKILIDEAGHNHRAIVQVDSGPGCERMWALRAGIGWQGKNNFLIVPGHGSWVWLGLITTDICLEPDKPQISLCGDCQRCLRACPTSAYREANSFDYQRCLAWHAANKGELSSEAKQALSKHKIIYGCDYCQLACPYNQPHDSSEHQHPSLKELLTLTGKEFQEQWQNTSAGWRGKNTLRRNTILAAAREPSLQDELEAIAAGSDCLAKLAQEVLRGLAE
jgi:epoxyqueuosine reductase